MVEEVICVGTEQQQKVNIELRIGCSKDGCDHIVGSNAATYLLKEAMIKKQHNP